MCVCVVLSFSIYVPLASSFGYFEMVQRGRYVLFGSCGMYTLLLSLMAIVAKERLLHCSF